MNGSLVPVRLEGDFVVLESGEKVALAEARPRLGPAVANPGKVLCIGRNYADHAKETGHEAPTTPEVFIRTRTSLCGPYDPIVKPSISDQLDYEVELAVVIGRPGRHITREEAMSHVFGYCIFNDGSVRDWQTRGTQWIPGKNFDSTGPLGPFVVTKDEVDDPHALHLTTRVGDEILQNADTSLLIHKIPDLIAFISEFTTLETNDIICTGTPAGVGMARQPQRWLQPGETVTCAIAGLGEISNPIVAENASQISR